MIMKRVRTMNNRFHFYCSNCKQFRYGVIHCIAKRHNLYINSFEYSPDFKDRVFAVLRRDNLFNAIIEKYELLPSLPSFEHTILFIARFVEKIETPIIDHRPLLSPLCPVHNKPPLGYCLTCNRNICFTEMLHFDHEYYIYEETKLTLPEQVVSQHSLTLLNDYNICFKQLTSYNERLIANNQTFDKFVSTIGKHLSSDINPTIKYGLIQCLQQFTEPVSDMICKDKSELETKLSTMKTALNNQVLPKEIAELNTSSEAWRIDLKDDFDTVIKYIFKNFIIKYLQSNVIRLKPKSEPLPETIIFRNSRLEKFNSLRINYSLKFIPINQQTADIKKTCFILENGKSVTLEKLIFTSHEVKRKLIKRTKHLISTTHVNTNLEIDLSENSKKNYFYFISDGKLIRWNLNKNIAHEKTKVLTCNGIILNEFISSEEDEILTPSVFNRLLTITNFNTNVIGIGVNDEIYYLVETEEFDENEDKQVVLTWFNYHFPFPISDLKIKLRYYIGSWLYDDFAHGMFISNKMLFVYNRPTTKIDCDCVRCYNKFKFVYTHRSIINDLQIIF